MATKDETRFRSSTYQWLKDLPNSYWESISQESIAGTLDRAGCVHGICIWLEYKTDKGVLSAIQKYKIAKWRSAGAIVFVVTPSNWKRIKLVLDGLATHGKRWWTTDGSEY